MATDAVVEDVLYLTPDDEPAVAVIAATTTTANGTTSKPVYQGQQTRLFSLLVLFFYVDHGERDEMTKGDASVLDVNASNMESEKVNDWLTVCINFWPLSSDMDTPLSANDLCQASLLGRRMFCSEWLMKTSEPVRSFKFESPIVSTNKISSTIDLSISDKTRIVLISSMWLWLTKDNETEASANETNEISMENTRPEITKDEQQTQVTESCPNENSNKDDHKTKIRKIFKNACYFLIKSINYENVDLAKSKVSSDNTGLDRTDVPLVLLFVSVCIGRVVNTKSKRNQIESGISGRLVFAIKILFRNQNTWK
jgi:hypothetical protein